MPARPPASMVMLQRVMRPSIDRACTASPAYSTAWLVAPAALIWAMIARIRSLGVKPGPSRPPAVMRRALGLRCHRVWVASTWATSLAPMPKASAPNAP